MLTLARIEERLRTRRPGRITADGDFGHAAVAVVLGESDAGPRMLFIERAQRAGDPWSGQMAFPGGRLAPEDADPRAAAERETHEELGLSLADADCLGGLDDEQRIPSAQSQLVVSAFVYRIDHDPILSPNDEVAKAIWIPVASLLDPARHVFYATRDLEFPGIDVGEPGQHVVWGLTYSFLESFFEMVEAPLPDRWSDETRRFRRSQRR